MTTSLWIVVGSSAVLFGVCGFALWASRLLAEAADRSAAAAEHAEKAARDAERAAADVREIRDLLRARVEQELRAAADHGQPAAAGTGRLRSDTAEAQAVLTPQAIIARGDASRSPDGARASRGRHASTAGSPWTAALRAAGLRGNRQ